jgi:hypothetical protein
VILKINNIDVGAATKIAQALIETDEELVLALKAAPDMLLLLVKLVINQKGLNSKKFWPNLRNGYVSPNKYKHE